jgi:hypothetical protein
LPQWGRVMSRFSPEKLDSRISDHTAQLIILWPLILLIAGAHFFVWQESDGAEDDLNLIGMALTIFEIFLIVALAGGFWMIRREAVDRAEEAARKVARDFAEQEVEKYAKAVVAPKLLRALIAGESDLAEGENEDLDEDSARDMIAKLDQ